MAASDPAFLLHCVYSRTRATGLPEDDAITTHHFRKTIAGDWPSSGSMTWASVEASLNSFFQALRTAQWFFGPGTPTTKPKEYRWYRQGDFQGDWGAVERVTPAAALTGTSTVGECPPQCAVAVTEYTGFQREDDDDRIVRHWGRFYLPGLTTNSLETDGSLRQTVATTLINQAEILYEALQVSGLEPVVPFTQHLSPDDLTIRDIDNDETVVMPGGYGRVKELRVDGIVDIIRRRRYDSPAYRLTRELPDPTP